MHISRSIPGMLGVGVAALALAACGGGSNKSGSSSSSSSSCPVSGRKGGANIAVDQGQQKGGTLNVVSDSGWEHLDPGQSYYQLDYIVVYSVHRPLYSFPPDSREAQPDLADGQPQISADGKTVTVKIKPNIKFGGAVNRTVTSDDVRYAIERTFNPNVPNGYATSYYPIVGAEKSKGGKISGIETPDKTTIVFHLTSAFGGTFIQALTLPG